MAEQNAYEIASELNPDTLKKIIEPLMASPVDHNRVANAVDAGFIGKGAAKAADQRELSDRLYGVFTALSNEEKGRAKWQRLRSDLPGLDRDRVILELWRLLDEHYPSHVESLGASLSYHRTWLFDWFLGRYDVRRSRRAVGGGGWAANTHLVLLVLISSLFMGRRWLPAAGGTPAWWWAAAVAVVYAVAVLLLALGSQSQLSGPLEAGVLALQSLLPRLAAAGVVGLVLLASSEELLALVAQQIPLPWLLLPLLGGYVYLLLEMARRVHPLPRLGRLILHGVDIWGTGLCHAMALTLVAERGLRKILDSDAAGPLDWQAGTRVAVFVFIIGLVVNLVWAETPVTEPL